MWMVVAVVVPVVISLVAGPDIRRLVVPTALMFLTVVAISFLAGRTAGVVAAVVSTLSLWFVNAPPGFSFKFEFTDDVVAVAAAGLVAVMLALTTDWLRSREQHAIRIRTALEQARADDGQTILALQQAVLPTTKPRVDGLSVATAYQVGGEIDSPVGGDWFAYVPLEGGRLGVAVGDVVGHGIEAVASMAEYRYTLRAIATEGLDADVVLNRLADLSALLGRRGVFTTCVYGIVDPTAGKLHLANAGHPPPLLIRGGQARALDIRNGPPIGAFMDRHDYHVTMFDLVPGDVLALYTDGLVERRDAGIDEGIDRLGRSLLSALARGAGAMRSTDELESFMVELVGPHATDDAALLLVHVMG